MHTSAVLRVTAAIGVIIFDDLSVDGLVSVAGSIVVRPVGLLRRLKQALDQASDVVIATRYTLQFLENRLQELVLRAQKIVLRSQKVALLLQEAVANPGLINLLIGQSAAVSLELHDFFDVPEYHVLVDGFSYGELTSANH